MNRQEAGLYFRLRVVPCSPVPPNKAVQTDGRFAAAADRQGVRKHPAAWRKERDHPIRSESPIAATLSGAQDQRLAPRDIELTAVFDSNVYLGLSRARLARIVDCERDCRVLSLASLWPCAELLARCAARDAAGRGKAKAALNKVLVHTGYESAGGTRIRMHEAGEFTLARGLFGLDLDEALQQLGIVGDLVVEASPLTIDEFRRVYSDDLDYIAEQVRLEEQRFAYTVRTALERFGKLPLNPSTPTPLDLTFVAAGLIQALAEQYGMKLEEQDSSLAVKKVVDSYAVALAFMFRLLADATPQSGPPGRGNSTWDLNVAFHAGRPLLSGVPTLLVSDDRRLLGAAREANHPLRVVRVVEYEALLSDPVAVKRRAEALLSGG